MVRININDDYNYVNHVSAIQVGKHTKGTESMEEIIADRINNVTRVPAP